MTAALLQESLVAQTAAFNELLEAAAQRVERACAGGNEAAIEAAKAAYFELREDIERAEQYALQAALDDRAESERDLVGRR